MLSKADRLNSVGRMFVDFGYRKTYSRVSFDPNLLRLRDHVRMIMFVAFMHVPFPHIAYISVSHNYIRSTATQYV